MKINDENYKEFLLRYMEEDLSAEELAEVDGFIDEEPVAIQELRALERTKAKPDMKIVFPHKESLKKKDTEVPVRKLMWYTARAASIAAMLVIAVLFHNEFAGKQDEQALLGTSEENNISAFNGKQDEGTAGEEASLMNSNENENPVNTAEVFPTINKATSAITPVTANKRTVSQSRLKTNNKQLAEINSANENPGVKSVYNISRHNEEIAEVSREQVQSALNLMKSKTVAYADASQYAPSADEFLKRYPNAKKLTVKSINTNSTETATSTFEEELQGSTLISAINKIFKKNVSIRKKQLENHKYYALTVETAAFKISKKIKANN